MAEPNVVLPKELRLAAPATMPQSRSYLFKQQAALSNYSPGDTIQINLPRLQRSYLTKDSYLEFEVTYTWTPTDATTNLTLDTCGAFGLIDRIEVYDYLGSTQLESTAGFGQLLCLLQDTSIDVVTKNFHWEATSGAENSSIVQDWDKKIPGTTALIPYRQLASTTGELVDAGQFSLPTANTSVPAATTTRTIRRRYHLPLFSFLGLLSPKYAPLHNGYTIMITLQSAPNALGAAGAKLTNTTWSLEVGTATYQITNSRMVCQILELGPIAESMLLSTTGGQPMIVPTKAYRNYKSNVTSKTSTFRLDLNINVASLTNIMWMMRPSWALNNLRFNSLSRRQRNYLESWYFQYGSSVLPQTQGISCFKPVSNNNKDVDTGSEALIELLKSRHMYNQPDHNHCLNKWNYAYDNWVRFREVVATRNPSSTDAEFNDIFYQGMLPATAFEAGKFALGLDLELVSGRTNEIICGMNTNGMNTSIFGTFNALAAAVTPTTTTTAGSVYTNAGDGVWVEDCVVDAYCEYDAFINVTPGIATTVSF
jgi:hypothetical protein